MGSVDTDEFAARLGIGGSRAAPHSCGRRQREPHADVRHFRGSVRRFGARPAGFRDMIIAMRDDEQRRRGFPIGARPEDPPFDPNRHPSAGARRSVSIPALRLHELAMRICAHPTRPGYVSDRDLDELGEGWGDLTVPVLELAMAGVWRRVDDGYLTSWASFTDH